MLTDMWGWIVVLNGLLFICFKLFGHDHRYKEIARLVFRDIKHWMGKFSQVIMTGTDGIQLLPESSLGLSFAALVEHLCCGRSKDRLSETSGRPDSINCNHPDVSAHWYSTFSHVAMYAEAHFINLWFPLNGNVFSCRSGCDLIENRSKGSGMKQTTGFSPRKVAVGGEVLCTGSLNNAKACFPKGPEFPQECFMEWAF